MSEASATKSYGGMAITVTGRDIKEVFKSIAAYDELFGDMRAAANIGGKVVTSDKVQLRMRVVVVDGKECEYYEMVCIDPDSPLHFWRKSFGQKQDRDKSLFPKNRAEQLPEGAKVGFNGWHYIEFKKKDEDK